MSTIQLILLLTFPLIESAQLAQQLALDRRIATSQSWRFSRQPIHELLLSPSRKHVACASGNLASVYDRSDGTWSHISLGSRVQRLTFSLDGRYLLAESQRDKGVFYVISTSTFHCVGTTEPPRPARVHTLLAWSKDQFIYTRADEGVYSWDCSSKSSKMIGSHPEPTFPRNAKRPESGFAAAAADYVAKDDLIVVGGGLFNRGHATMELVVFRRGSNRPLCRWSGREGSVWNLCASPFGEHVIVDAEKTVDVVDLKRGSSRTLFSLPSAAGWSWSNVAFSPSGASVMFIAPEGQRLVIFEVLSGGIRWSQAPAGTATSSLQLGQSGEVMIGHKDGTIELKNLISRGYSFPTSSSRRDALMELRRASPRSAFTAMRKLSADPATVELSHSLICRPDISDESIVVFCKRLDHRDYREREKAKATLIEIGARALTLLRREATAVDGSTRDILDRVIESIANPPPSQQLFLTRVLEVLAMQNTGRSREILQSIGNLDKTAYCCRYARWLSER